MSETHRPLRVGFYLFFPGGGIGRYTHELMAAMAGSSNARVKALCVPEYEWADADQYTTWEGLVSISHDVPLFRRLRFLKGQFVNPLRAMNNARKSGLDILHFSHINHLSFPFWKKQLERMEVRVAATAHDVRRQNRIVSRWWEERQLKSFYRFVDALFVHSEHQVEKLIEFADANRKKIHVVPHGPYEHGPAPNGKQRAREKWDLPRDRPVALFFGQVRDEKNLDNFIEAVVLSSTSPAVVVAGRMGGRRHRGPDYYRGIADQLGVDEQIRFIPRHITDEETGELFTASDWVALPYQEEFTSQSGVLNVAAHYERPVLVGGAPVLQETVQASDIGVTCATSSPQELAKGIDAITQKVSNGYHHAFEEYQQNHSWEENARRTLAVYRKIVGSGHE